MQADPAAQLPEKPQSADGSGLNSHHANWIKARVFSLLSHFWMPDDESLARAQARDWISVLLPYTRAEIDAACIAYLSQEERRPKPASIVGLIRAARREEIERARALAPPVEDREPSEPRLTHERAAEIMDEVGFRPRQFGGGR